jgi:transposase-like protein
MKKSPKFSPEVRERAVRMVQEHRAEYPLQWAAIESTASKIGCVPQTLHTWVKQHEVDAGHREGVSTAVTQRIKDLERENRELRRANEILKLASALTSTAALAETINGLYKAEVIHRRGPWKTKQAVELATLEWVSWFNHHRLMGPLGNVPPAQFEANDQKQRAGQAATV